MQASISSFLARPDVRRWACYLWRAAIVLGLLGVFCAQASAIPPVLAALVWAALSSVAALGAAYQVVMRKTYKQGIFEVGGRLARWNGGRMLTLSVSFVVSAACVASLMLAAPVWNAGKWCVVCVCSAGLVGVFALVERLMAREVHKAYRCGWSLLVTCGLVGALMCVGCLAVSTLTAGDVPSSAADAFAAAPKPLADSPSALLSQAGLLSSLVDGLTSAVFAKIPGVNWLLYTGVRAVLDASALFGLAAALGACALSTDEIRRVFTSLEPPADTGGVAGGVVDAAAATKPAPVRKYVICACVLPALLVAGFLVADAQVAKAVATKEVTAAEGFVRDTVDIAVYVMDGKYYDQQQAYALANETRGRSAQLASDAASTLPLLVNAIYDACLDNVDAYLDWYYSLPADYTRLAGMVTGSVDEYVQNTFKEKIQEGVDESMLAAQLDMYRSQAEELEQDYKTRLASLEVTGVPGWIVTPMDMSGISLDFADIAPEAQMMTMEGRATVGAVSGAAVGVAVGEKLVSKMGGKEVFKKLVAKITEKLGSKAAGSAVGGVVGGVLGSVLPGAGTAAGAAVGVAAGAAASAGVDYGLLKLDEWQNRDEYRQQIMDAIEQARADTLAQLNEQTGGEASEEGTSAEGETQPDAAASGFSRYMYESRP